MEFMNKWSNEDDIKAANHYLNQAKEYGILLGKEEAFKEFAELLKILPEDADNVTHRVKILKSRVSERQREIRAAIQESLMLSEEE